MIDTIGAISFCVWSPTNERWSVAVFLSLPPEGSAMNYQNRVVPTFALRAERDAGAVGGTIDRLVHWRLARAYRKVRDLLVKGGRALGFGLDVSRVLHGRWLGCPTSGVALLPDGAPGWLRGAVEARVHDLPFSYLDDQGVLRDARYTGYDLLWFDPTSDDDREVRASVSDPEMTHLPERRPLLTFEATPLPTQTAADECAVAVVQAAVAAHRDAEDVEAAVTAAVRRFTPGWDEREDVGAGHGGPP